MKLKREPKFIYAIRSRTGLKDILFGQSPQRTIGCLSDRFILAIAGECTTTTTGLVVRQERNKLGQFLFSFERKEPIEISNENILVCFPIICHELDDKIYMQDDDFRRLLNDFKTILNSDDSDEESFSKHSESRQQISSIEQRSKGRPKRSRNKRKNSGERSSQESYFDDSHRKYEEKRGRGRPRGAKNIRKSEVEDTTNEYNLSFLFSFLLQIKSIEEVNTKLSRLRDRDDKLNPTVKKEELSAEENIKRARGRPKGVKNKPKVNCQSSESQQTAQLQVLPKRKHNKHLKAEKCCSRCVDRQNKKLILDGKVAEAQDLRGTVFNLGVEDTSNILISAIKQGQVALLRTMLAQRRFIETEFVISWDANLRLQPCGYTVRTKKEYVSKRRREGIHALIQDSLKVSQVWWRALGIERILESVPNSKTGIQIYEEMVRDDEAMRTEVYLHVATLVRNGNDQVALHLLEKILQDEDNNAVYGFSKDHFECLNRKRSEMQFRKTTMLKQNATADFCSPIHCAVINPNVDLLSFILKHISQFNVGDSLNRRPIHYAATLESTKAIDLLVKHGADLKDIDKRKMTPLMVAAKAGRHRTLKFILEKVRDAEYINFKGDQGLTAMHYAVIGKHSDCISLLLDDPLVKVPIETKEGMNILHIAAGAGQVELIKVLYEKYSFSEGDNYRRTALMFAIRNNQNDAFFYLFSQNMKYFKRDYSYNTLLHYAAAYGNLEVLKYLLDMHMPQTMNRKSFYPFEIAVLKGHLACARLLQNWNLHYSQHLLNRILKNPRGTNEFYAMVKYLLESKRYDLNYRNPIANGNTCLHFVCTLSEEEYNRQRMQESANIRVGQFQEMQRMLLSWLLENDADPTIVNDKGQTPVALCIHNENLTGIQLLLQEIPFELQPQTRNSHFIFYLTNLACLGSSQIKFVYQKITQAGERVLRTELHKTDCQGFEFLAFLVKRFTETVHIKFKTDYLKHRALLSQVQLNLQEGELDRLAVLEAFREYLLHEEWLIKLVAFLVDNGSDPKFLVCAPHIENEHENYRKWGIQHFLMRFPSPNLLKIFMRWIDTNFNLQNSEGRTPLHLFCLWNKEGSLFDRGDPNNPLPPLNYPQMKQFRGLYCLEYLLDNGLTSNVLDINRSTPLLYASLSGQLGFINLLRTFGSTINNVNSLNQIPLIELIKTKEKFSVTQIENIFMEEGANPDFRDLNNRNVLHHLVCTAKSYDSSPELCQKLLSHGVGVNSLDKFGRSPIFYCFIQIDEEVLEEKNKLQILKVLLGQKNIDLNVLDCSNRTPLHYACEHKFFFSIMYLLDRDIDHSILDWQGNTPLGICLLHDNLNQAALLIKKGVGFGYVVEEQESYSYFKYAIKKRSVAICLLLLDNGYPLKIAIEETESEPFKQVLLKRIRRTQ